MTRRWEVEVTETAWLDAREAAPYTRDQIGSPQAASRFVDEFEAQCKILASMPERRPLASDYELAKLGYRWCPVGHFMMFYRTDDAALTVTIDKILFGARDWKSLLQ